MQYEVITWTPIYDERLSLRFGCVQAAQWVAASVSLATDLPTGVYEAVSPGVCHRFYERGVCRYARPQSEGAK